MSDAHDDDEMVEIEMDTSETLEIPPRNISVWALIFLTPVGLAMIYFAIIKYTDLGAGPVEVILVGLVGVFLTCAVIIGAFRKYKGKQAPNAILSPQGFGMSNWDGKFLPWNSLNGVSIRGHTHVGNMIHLSFDGDAMKEMPLSKANLGLMRAGKQLGFGELGIAEKQTSMPIQLVYIALLNYAYDHAKKDFAKAQLDEVTEILQEQETA